MVYISLFVLSPASKPLLLLMDGHSSHYYPQTIYKAAEDTVVLFVLPPNNYNMYHTAFRQKLFWAFENEVG